MVGNGSVGNVIFPITNIDPIKNSKPQTASRTSIAVVQNTRESAFAEYSINQFWSVIELGLTKQSMDLCRTDSPLSFDIFIYPFRIMCNSFCVGFGNSTILLYFLFCVSYR